MKKQTNQKWRLHGHLIILKNTAHLLHKGVYPYLGVGWEWGRQKRKRKETKVLCMHFFNYCHTFEAEAAWIKTKVSHPRYFSKNIKWCYYKRIKVWKMELTNLVYKLPIQHGEIFLATSQLRFGCKPKPLAQTVKIPRRFKAIVFPLLLLGLKEI